MASTIGTPGAVRRKLNISSDELTDDEANDFLGEAERYLKARFYEDFMLDRTLVYPNNSGIVREYGTFFPMKTDSDLVKVYYEGSLLTQDSDYTVDTSNSKITLSDDLGIMEGGFLAIFYAPEFFDDFANALAAKYIIQRNLVNLSEGNDRKALYDLIKEQVDEYTKMSNKPIAFGSRDHKRVTGMF